MLSLDRIINQINRKNIINNRKYYNWEHWSNDWLITTLWYEIKDIVKDWEKHKWHISNYIKIIMDDYSQLLSGTWVENFEWVKKSDIKYLKKIDFSKFSKFRQDLLLTWYAFVRAYEHNNWKVILESHWADQAFELFWKTYIVDIEKDSIFSFTHTYNIFVYDWITVKKYKNKELIYEKSIGYNPYTRIWNWIPLIDNNFLRLQDDINVSLTRINKTEKMVADPFISITWLNIENLNDYQMLSWQIKAFPKTDTKITKLANDSVDSNFYVTLEKYVNTLFQMAKLNGYQNLKQSSYTSIAEVVSSMWPTITLINSIKTNIKWQLTEMFEKTFNLLFWFTVKNFEFNYQPTEVDLLKQSTKESIESDLLTKKSEQNLKIASALNQLSMAWYTKDEAKEILNIKY